MAIMIPSTPREYLPESKEGLAFDALKKGLPDDYYVFHSVRRFHLESDEVQESECDFIVYNRQKGFLFIEAKAGGGIKYIDGDWYYTSGALMSHNGPYNQASNNKYNFRNDISKSAFGDVVKRCKFMHAVWFIDIRREDLGNINMPTEADMEITLTLESLADPLPDVERIFSLKYRMKGKKVDTTEITDSEEDYLLRGMLCPEFHVFAPSTFLKDAKNGIFNRMLAEQQNLLNYLVDQHTAVINGAAGTGKTMVAIEKASRCASGGDMVLFLCYNTRLNQWLKKNKPISNVEYYTLDGLACKLCNTGEADYKMLKARLAHLYNMNEFPWKHVVVDEGQDFGREDIDESDILDQLKKIIERLEGDFYVFYDKLQQVQGKKVPDCITDADCKLTLYRNCRNTERIAQTSLRPISERKPKMFDGAILGDLATIYYAKEENEMACALQHILDSYKGKGYDSIAVLTCETKGKSRFTGLLEGGKYKELDFETCRKFKGLEADAVILVDVTKDLFTEENAQRFYVGASRAKFRLDIIASMDEEDCREALENYFKYKKVNFPTRTFASALNADEFSPVVEQMD